mmetsp:Transcript_56938/g.182989  ORF Transcript_56938/g.182989 Transcript_56938/m.182989 type:complete len:249 (+) Transcript_56938:94-840(+)
MAAVFHGISTPLSAKALCHPGPSTRRVRGRSCCEARGTTKKADSKRACSALVAASCRAAKAALAADPVLAYPGYVANRPPPVQPATPPKITRLPCLHKLQAALRSKAQEQANDRSRSDRAFDAETSCSPDRMMFGLFRPEPEDDDSTAMGSLHFSADPGEPGCGSLLRHGCLAGNAGLSLRKPSRSSRGRSTRRGTRAAGPAERRHEPAVAGQHEGHGSGEASMIPVAPAAPPGPPPQRQPRRLRRSE